MSGFSGVCTRMTTDPQGRVGTGPSSSGQCLKSCWMAEGIVLRLVAEAILR